MLEYELKILRERQESAAASGNALGTAQIGVVIALIEAGAQDIEKLLGVIGERIPHPESTGLGTALHNWVTRAATVTDKTLQIARRPELRR